MSELLCPHCRKALPQPEPVVEWEGWRYSPGLKAIFAGGRTVDLTPPQVSLFRILLSQQGGRVPHWDLYNLLYAHVHPNRRPKSKTIINVMVHQTRRALASAGYPSAIRSQYISGFYLAPAKDAKQEWKPPNRRVQLQGCKEEGEV